MSLRGVTLVSMAVNMVLGVVVTCREGFHLSPGVTVAATIAYCFLVGAIFNSKDGA